MNEQNNPRHAIQSIACMQQQQQRERAFIREWPYAPLSATCISAKRPRCQHGEYTGCQAIGDGSRGGVGLARLCIFPHRYGTCLDERVKYCAHRYGLCSRPTAGSGSGSPNKKGTCSLLGWCEQCRRRQEDPHATGQSDTTRLSCSDGMGWDGQATSWEVPSGVNAVQ